MTQVTTNYKENQCNQKLVFEINTIDKHLSMLIKKKRQKLLISKLKKRALLMV